jgi:hypothetical protein
MRNRAANLSMNLKIFEWVPAVSNLQKVLADGMTSWARPSLAYGSCCKAQFRQPLRFAQSLGI